MYYEPLIGGIVYEYTINTTIVPAPSTISLFGLGLAVLAGSRRGQGRKGFALGADADSEKKGGGPHSGVDDSTAPIG